MIGIDITYSWESEGLVNDSAEVLSLGYWENLGTIKRNTKVNSINSKTTGFLLDGNSCPAGH